MELKTEERDAAFKLDTKQAKSFTDMYKDVYYGNYVKMQEGWKNFTDQRQDR